MKLPDLRHLDQRYLPLAARRLRAFVDAAEGRRRRALRAGSRGWRTGLAAVSAWSARADHRWAASGPLRVLRDAPQLALLLVGAVFVSSAVAAVWLAEPQPPAPAAPTTAGPLAQTSLGVPPGADVEEHLAQNRMLLEQLAVRRPDGRYLALLSLDRYFPVAEVSTLIEGLTPQRVYLRAPGVDKAETVEVPFAGTGARSILTVLCTATASRKAADAQNLRALASTLEVSTPEQELQRSDFEGTAARNAAEAQAFTGECATAFAVVVEAEASVLVDLLDRPGVRGVEAAPAGVGVLELRVAPLFPEVTGRVAAADE